MQVKTNIGKVFLPFEKAISSELPNFFNKNAIKLSYICTGYLNNNVTKESKHKRKIIK